MLLADHHSANIIYRVGKIKRGKCSFFCRSKAHFRELR